MATRALRPCKRVGCGRLTRNGWCERHRPTYQRGESAQWHGLYALPVWRDLREAQLIREPWCAECTKRGERTRATVVDHVQPHRGDVKRFVDEANLQSLCKTCHDRKTLRERRERL